MFKDSVKIGQKLKGFGIGIRIVGIVTAVIWLFSQLVLLAEATQESRDFVFDIFSPGITLFCALIGGWLIEGIGQIVLNTGALVKSFVPEEELLVAQFEEENSGLPAQSEELENSRKPPVVPRKLELGGIACPSCGLVQHEDRRVCYKCGQRFKAAEETAEILVEAELHEGDYVDITCPKCGEALCFLADTENAVCPVCDTKIKLS